MQEACMCLPGTPANPCFCTRPAWQEHNLSTLLSLHWQAPASTGRCLARTLPSTMGRHLQEHPEGGHAPLPPHTFPTRAHATGLCSMAGPTHYVIVCQGLCVCRRRPQRCTGRSLAETLYIFPHHHGGTIRAPQRMRFPRCARCWTLRPGSFSVPSGHLAVGAACQA